MILATLSKVGLGFLFVVGFVQAFGCSSAMEGDRQAVVEAQGRANVVNFVQHRHGASVMLESETGPGVRVWLGSERYLIEQDFVPKVGEMVEVSGFEISGSEDVREILATSVTLVSSDRSLALPQRPEAAVSP